MNDKTKMHLAQSVYKKALPLNHQKATPAIVYLKNQGITHYPDDFKFMCHTIHPYTWQAVSALVAPIRKATQEIIGVARFFLTHDGQKCSIMHNMQKERGMMRCTLNTHLGVIEGGAVMVNNGESDTVYLCEGLETALTIGQKAPQDKVLAVLSVSNFKHFSSAVKDKKIIICMDSDINQSNHSISLTKTLHYVPLAGTYLPGPLSNQ